MPYELKKDGRELTLVATGKDIKQAFLDGARGFLHVLSGGKAVREQEKAEIVVQAGSMDSLYREWLSEIMQQSISREILFSDVSIFVVDKSGKEFVLTGSASGEKISKSDPRYGLFPQLSNKASCSQTNGARCEITITSS